MAEIWWSRSWVRTLYELGQHMLSRRPEKHSGTTVMVMRHEAVFAQTTEPSILHKSEVGLEGSPRGFRDVDEVHVRAAPRGGQVADLSGSTPGMNGVFRRLAQLEQSNGALSPKDVMGVVVGKRKRAAYETEH
jgi:hypothetical protein